MTTGNSMFILVRMEYALVCGSMEKTIRWIVLHKVVKNGIARINLLATRYQMVDMTPMMRVPRTE